MTKALEGGAVGDASNAVHAVNAVQLGVHGKGGALNAHSDNPDAPAVTVSGAGTLLELRDAHGNVVYSISQTGAGTTPADFTTTGSITAFGNVGAGGLVLVGGTGQLSDASGVLTSATDVAVAAGHGFRVKEGGAAARMGTAVLTGATPVVVATTSVTANSRIFVQHNAPGGTPAFCWISARSVGVSFSITGSAGDTSTVAWLIVEPAA